jgi:hypothetical protein
LNDKQKYIEIIDSLGEQDNIAVVGNRAAYDFNAFQIICDSDRAAVFRDMSIVMICDDIAYCIIWTTVILFWQGVTHG